MPVDWTKYPADWKAIALAVKEASGWKCEPCGKQCHRPGERVMKTQDVLTVAHVNHDESDCRPENLVAACAVCHLRYDNERRRWQRLAAKRIKREAEDLAVAMARETQELLDGPPLSPF